MSQSNSPDPLDTLMTAPHPDYPDYYGHKPLHPSDVHSADLKETSIQIQENLLHLTASNPPLNSALMKIFKDPGWRSQSQPIDVTVLRQSALRPKLSDDNGNVWYPCQLGCVNGMPENSRNRITQPVHMTEHIEWHLGMKRQACRICLDTFVRKRDCELHEATHANTEGKPCPAGCGQRFEGGRSFNISRHLKWACPITSQSTSATASTVSSV